MNVVEFLERWRPAGAAERANKDIFLAELCDVLGVERPLPKTNDPEQDRYVFEKDVARSRASGTLLLVKEEDEGAEGSALVTFTEQRGSNHVPQQVAAVRDLLAEAGALDLARAKAAFKGAKDDGLAALGLAVASGAGPARSWSAVR